jgi:DNA-directed RNA polymerase subunit RPC12/RpoP
MCHICAKTFPTQGVLKGHLYSHVAKSERKQCKECGKWLKSDLTLRVHMRSHSGRVFRCPNCSKAFKCKQNMRDHMRSHSNARPYKCLACGKTFKLRSGLRVSKYMPVPKTIEVYIGPSTVSIYFLPLFFSLFNLFHVWFPAVIKLYSMVPIQRDSVYITLYCVSAVMIFGPSI